MQRIENYGAKIEKEAFRTCDGTRRDRTEEAFVQNVISLETAARKASMDIMRGRLDSP